MSDGRENAAAYELWMADDPRCTLSVETQPSPIDKYGVENFARDNTAKFLQLIDYMTPRDAELLICFALLQKGPTELSILFGKAGHRCETDLHQAAHKLAGLIEFGPLPKPARLSQILRRNKLHKYGGDSLAECVTHYARKRTFANGGLRSEMLRVLKILHRKKGRDEGLLAGWLLWLVHRSIPIGTGWKQSREGTTRFNLGPTEFRCFDRSVEKIKLRHDGRGGQGQHPCTVQIKRHMSFKNLGWTEAQCTD